METTPELSLDTDQRRAFEVAKHAATRVLHRRTRLLRLLNRSFRKLAKNQKALSEVKEDVRAMIRMANAWAFRRYRGLPWRTVLYTVAALVYFVNPIDLIPDALLGIGFVDDLAVLGAVLNAIRQDLVHFRDWEDLQGDDWLPPSQRPALPPASDSRSVD